MSLLRFTVFALVLLWGLPALAADCTLAATFRDGRGFTVNRYLLADGKTGAGVSTKCVPPETGGTSPNATAGTQPWDYYRFFAEEGNTCTSWTAVVRDYPLNTTSSQCRGTCDAHTLVTFDKTGTTSKSYNEPLGEALDINVTTITCTGGLSVYVDFYYRNQGK